MFLALDELLDQLYYRVVFCVFAGQYMKSCRRRWRMKRGSCTSSAAARYRPTSATVSTTLATSRLQRTSCRWDDGLVERIRSQPGLMYDTVATASPSTLADLLHWLMLFCLNLGWIFNCLPHLTSTRTGWQPTQHFPQNRTKMIDLSRYETVTTLTDTANKFRTEFQVIVAADFRYSDNECLNFQYLLLYFPKRFF